MGRDFISMQAGFGGRLSVLARVRHMLSLPQSASLTAPSSEGATGTSYRVPIRRLWRQVVRFNESPAYVFSPSVSFADSSLIRGSRRNVISSAIGRIWRQIAAALTRVRRMFSLPQSASLTAPSSEGAAGTSYRVPIGRLWRHIAADTILARWQKNTRTVLVRVF